MAEEEKPEDEGVSKVEESTVEDFGIDRAEFDRLQAQDARIKKMDEFASEADIDNAEEYVQRLEDSVYEKEEKVKEAPPKPEEKPKEKVDEATTTLIAETEANKKVAQQAQATANNALLAVQYGSYKLSQDSIEKELKSPATKDQLIKIITGPEQMLVGSLAAKKFDGNVFDAANYIFTVNEGAEASRKAGADAEIAKSNAIASASAPGNRGRIAEPSTKTPEDKAAELNKTLADDIAPDTEYVMPN